MHWLPALASFPSLCEMAGEIALLLGPAAHWTLPSEGSWLPVPAAASRPSLPAFSVPAPCSPCNAIEGSLKSSGRKWD